MKWDEEVKLQPGELVIIARTAAFSENWIAGGGGGSFNKGMTLQIIKPNKKDNPNVWSTRFVPIVLDRDEKTNEWFVIATFFHCDSWYELGRPKLPYTEFRFRNDRWQQQALTETLVGRQSNVLPADLYDKGAIVETKSALTVERKEGILSNPAMGARFKRILGTWSTNC